MGRIDTRLTKVLQIVKSGSNIPIIVETIRPPSSSDVQELNSEMSVRRVSTIANQVYGTADETSIKAIASFAFVSTVFYDEPVSRFQFLAPSISISKKDIHIPISDSAQYIGAADLHDEGITGKGVKVAVVDTGVNKNHPLLEGAVKTQINIAKKNGAEFADINDGNGHGCFCGETKVFTENHGLISLKDVWNSTKSDIIKDDKGEYKVLYDKTISRNGITCVNFIYRTKSNKKIIISTPHKTISCTTWHKMFVCTPLNDNDGKRRWYKGVDIRTVEAKFLKRFESSNLTGDNLLNSNYYGYTWTRDFADAEIAYLHGLYYGDGHIDDAKLRYNEIRITDDSEDFLKKISEMYGGSVRECHNSKGFNISIYGRNLARDINNMSIDSIFKDIELMRAWLAGFFDAEGYVNEKENKVSICNTELDLLKNICEILNIVGVPCNVVSGGVSGITSLSPGCISYHLYFYVPETLFDLIGDYCIKKKEELSKIVGKKGHGKVLKLHDDILFTPITGIKFSDCDSGEYFYDLSTEEGNYCVDGFIVHNSHVATTIGGRDRTIYSKLFGKQIRIHGVAPEVEIIGIKVLDDGGSGQTSWVIEGMEAAVEAGANVINMSLGSMWDGGGLTPDSKVVDEIVFNHNILCAIAAGNSFANLSIGSPGGSHGAITVGSNAMVTPAAGIVSTFSSKGTTTDGRVKPDISAPGGNMVNIKETIYAGTSGMLAEEAGEDYIGIMGTSMAAPHIAGCLALLLQAGMKKDRYVAEDLIGSTAKFQHPKDIYTGWGMIDVKKAYDYLVGNKTIFPISAVSRVIGIPLRPLAALMPQSEQTIESRRIGLPYIR